MISVRKQRKQWTEPTADAASIRRFSQRLEVSEVVATLLWERNQRDTSIARDFLSPRLAGLDDPFAIENLKAVVSRIRKALERSESVVVFGDYDVDGVTSTVLLMHILTRFGLKPASFVPHRLDEGYGLSVEALERVLESGKPDLLMAVDCGTNSREPVAFLRKQGIDVIILDHHASKEALPDDCLLVNPHVHDAPDQPWTNLSAVGIVFKVVHGLLKELRAEGDDLAHEIQLKDFLDLVALGTICDLVPLTGENRILARHGLRLIQKGQRIGICALMEASGWRPGDEITPIDVSFRLGPRINASGRLADASGPIELLLSEDWQFARTAAGELDAFNRERQAIEKVITATATEMVENEFIDQLGLVLHHPDWHSGVVGIVASRISNRYHRPTLVLGAEGAEIKGSGRSIPGVNLVEVLQRCEQWLKRWGGHPMAVGMSTDPELVEGLREAFNAALSEQFDKGLPDPILKVDCWVETSALSEALLNELEQLEPFGQKNPEPVFALKNIRLRDFGPFGKGHLKFNIPGHNGNGTLSGVGWNRGADLADPALAGPIDLACRFHWNHWNGRKEARLTLVDWRPAR